ncbi:MAG: DUF2169 domain-containing protein [Polyangiaceae bacterium]
MDVTSHCPLSIGALFWRPSADSWALTIACKATFRLVPGLLVFHEAREDIHSEEVTWEGGGLRAPCDLVPYKPQADVLLVGRGGASRLGRVGIGKVDKPVEAARLRAGALGPVSLAGPEATARLGPLAASFGPFGWRTRPLPANLDTVCFQSAPTDQLTPYLRWDEAIALDQLVADHPTLRSRLPGLRPRAVLERADAAPRPLPAVADTLWIDLDRAVATLVWRVRTAVLHPAEPGSVTITLESVDGRRVESDARLRSIPAADLVSAWSQLEGDRPAGAAEEKAALHETAKIPVKKAPSASGTLPTAVVLDRESALPFQAPAAAPAAPNVPVAAAPPNVPVAAALPNVPVAAALPNVPVAAALPGVVAAPGGAPPVPNVPVAPPAVMVPVAKVPVAPAMPGQSVGERLAGQGAIAPIGPERAGRRRIGEGESAEARPASVDAIEVLWFDEAAPPKLRAHREWRSWIAPGKQERRDPADERTPEERKRDRHLREIGVVLRRQAALDFQAIGRALSEAGSAGVLSAPLVVAAGEMTPLLEEAESLRAAVAACAPFAAGDRRLKETMEWVKEMLQTPGFESAVGVADGVMAKLADAFGEARRALPPGYLDSHVERSLLQRRCYQKRNLRGAEHLRATLRVSPGNEPVAVYVPVAAATLLPMFRSFRVRILAEARPPQEPGEALSFMALAVATIMKG